MKKMQLTGCAVALSLATPFVMPSTAGAAGPGGGGGWTVVESFALPEGASGLAWDGTWLYCGIYGVNGGDVHRIDPSDGSTTLHFSGPQGDAFGLTWDGSTFWTTDHSGSSSTPAVALQLDGSGALLDSVELPAHYMSGIAYDDGAFWVARYYEDPSQIYKVDAAGTVLDSFQAPDDQPWDICVQDGALWIADYYGDTLYQIDAARGSVITSHPCADEKPAGVVWDGTHLWYCDEGGSFSGDVLYKVDLNGGGTPDVEVPAPAHDFGLVPIGTTAQWDVTVENTGDGPLVIDGMTFAPPASLWSSAAFPVTIAPGGNASLPVHFAPTVFGALSATATIVSNDPVDPGFALDLAGQALFAEATMAITSATHDYGAVRAGAHTRWFLEVNNHGNDTLTVNALDLPVGAFFVDAGTVLPLDLAPLEMRPIGVWFAPGAATSYNATLTVQSNDAGNPSAAVDLSGAGDDTPAPIGTVLWSYTIDVDFDNTPKAMLPITDISGDGVADVIVCSEDDFVRAFNGNASGIGDVLWEHEVPGGSVYQQQGLQIIPDIDRDGVPDVVIGAAWAGKLIRAISGATGAEIWTYATDEYGDGGWVYQVDARFDFNADGSVDVLAATGDDSSDTGPKRVFCRNGLSGVSIWERPLGGPVFSVIGVEDFTGDGYPDVIAGASNENETQGSAYGIDGRNGMIEWSFPTPGSSVWALAGIDDVTGDGIADVMIGDFFGNVFGLDAADGSELYSAGGFGLMTRFERMNDVTGDGIADVMPAHLSSFARMLSGQSGTAAWTTALPDKAAAVTGAPDLNGDGIDDVVVGTLFSDNFVYYLDGATGATLEFLDYGTPVDGIRAIPDITGDGSWEVVVGGRDGTLTCLSGGLNAGDPADINGDGSVDFNDLVLLLSAWGPGPGNPADIDGDGTVGFADLLLVLAAWSP